MLPITDPILIFTLLALTMLVLPLLAERLRIPDLVLLLGAGALLGPNGLGLLARNSAITLFGSVGILYIMFLAGLEIDLHRFAKTRARCVVFGLLTFAVPQVVGTLAGRFVLEFAWPTALLLASMFASHTLLAYPIASRLGISRSEPVAVTVGATIITDTLALLVLAVIADTARGVALGPVFWLNISGGLAALVALTWWGIPLLARWFFNQVTETGGAQFLFVILTVCGCAYLSHFAKMEPIIGAFLAGAAFNRLIPEHSSLMSRVVFAGHTLFIPFFLISVGMMVDPQAIVANPRSWFVGAAMIVLVVATKYGAAWLTGRAFGYSPAARNVMFGLSVVQAAATLAAVLVGYNLHIFDDTVLNGAIAMIAVTCPLGAWMVDRHGQTLAREAPPAVRSVKSDQHLLVPVTNPAFATKLLDLAFLLRDTARPGSIHPITIVRDETDVEEAMAKGEKLLAECLSHAAAAELPVEPTIRVDVNTSDGIIRAAKELHISLVVAGWGGSRTPSARLFGSVMERLIDNCPARLLFCRLPKPLNTMRRLLVLLPPLSARHSDLPQFLCGAKQLSLQVGADLRLYLTERDSAAVRRQAEEATPSRPLTFIASDSLVAARTRLLDDILPDDLILLLGERQNSILRTPALDKLATLVLSRHPANNLLLAYPALAAFDAPERDEETAPGADALRVCPVEVRSGAVSADELLQEMAGRACPDDTAAADEACRLLRSAAKHDPAELTADTLLLHAHCEAVSQPVLVIAFDGRGCRFPGRAEGPRLLLALLNPAANSPERHLKTLAEIGRRFRDPLTAERLRRATSAAEIAELFTG